VLKVGFNTIPSTTNKGKVQVIGLRFVGAKEEDDDINDDDEDEFEKKLGLVGLLRLSIEEP
jgi:hypothetical protein